MNSGRFDRSDLAGILEPAFLKHPPCRVFNPVHERKVQQCAGNGADTWNFLEDLQLKEDRHDLFGRDLLLGLYDEQVFELMKLIEPLPSRLSRSRKCRDQQSQDKMPVSLLIERITIAMTDLENRPERQDEKKRNVYQCGPVPPAPVMAPWAVAKT